MTASKNTAAKSDSTSVEETKLSTVPTQSVGDDQQCDQTDEKLSVVSKAKAFVVTNKKSILGAVAAVATVALVAVAKAKKDAQKTEDDEVNEQAA